MAGLGFTDYQAAPNYQSDYVGEIADDHMEHMVSENIEIVYGKGKQKTKVQAAYDYYIQTGVFKPGYNLQLGVSDEYIVHLGVYPNPGDVKTFIPFMKSYKEKYEFLPKWPVGAAGYGSYENYFYCLESWMNLSMKYNMYAKKHDSKFKKRIYNSINWPKNEEGYKICPEEMSLIST